MGILLSKRHRKPRNLLELANCIDKSLTDPVKNNNLLVEEESLLTKLINDVYKQSFFSISKFAVSNVLMWYGAYKLLEKK